MADPRTDHIDFDVLERELHAAVEADARYWRENDAKFRAVEQKVATYEEFKDIVAAAHLQPLEKKDHIQDKFTQPWNVLASKQAPNETSGKAVEPKTNRCSESKLPANGIEFSRDWRRLCESPREKYEYLTRLATLDNHLARIFKPEISHGLLGDFLCSLQSEFKPDADSATSVVSVLEQLSSAGRFDLSLTFLSSQEAEAGRQLFEKLGKVLSEHGESSGDAEKLETLRKRYKLEAS